MVTSNLLTSFDQIARIISKRLGGALILALFFAGLSTPKWSSAQLVDVSNELGLYTDHTGGNWGAGISMADFNNDGKDDLSFAHYGGLLKFYRGNGVGFEEVVLNLPEYLKEAKGILWADIDNDGDQDLFVSYRLSPNKMYLNDGGLSFTDISGVCGIAQSAQRSYGASFGDYDNDGLLDLFVANYIIGQDYPHNELYRNLGGGFFEDVTLDSEIGEVTDNSFQGHWVDFDEDGILDLHVIQDRLCFENKYYRQSEGSFVNEASAMGLDYSINCMSTSVADYDRDHDFDLYLAAGMFEGNFLLDNMGGNFSPHIVESGDSTAVHRTSWAANWFDADNDGWEDLHVATGFSEFSLYPQVFMSYSDVPNHFFWNNEGVFEKDTSAVLSANQLSFATAVGDFNGDGFPDLVSHTLGEYAQVLKSTPNGNSWIKVMLEGVESNRDGIGAKISLFADGEVSYRMTFCGENYMGQNSRWEIFGLGNQTVADSLQVSWPSGIEDVFYDLDALQYFVVVEGSSADLGPCPNLPSGCLGCTYAEACNFEEQAMLEDGSCDFSCFDGSASCGPGTEWHEQLGQCVQTEMNDCPADINNDGVVTMTDLLWFLSDFNQACPE